MRTLKDINEIPDCAAEKSRILPDKSKFCAVIIETEEDFLSLQEPEIDSFSSVTNVSHRPIGLYQSSFPLHVSKIP